MATTLTPYLGLRVDSTLTPNAIYNLNRIDSLAGRLTLALNGNTTLQSSADIVISARTSLNTVHANGTITLDAGSLQSLDTTSTININARNINLNTDDSTLDNVVKKITLNAPIIDFKGAQLNHLSLPEAEFYIGGADGYAHPQSITGDITIDSNGVVDISPNAVHSTDILDGAITTSKLDSHAVTTAKLAYLSVGTPQLQLASVDNTILAPGAVTTSTIQSGSIIDASVASNAAINWSKLATTGMITNGDISGTAAISQSKINGLVGTLAGKQNTLTFGTITTTTPELNIVGTGATVGGSLSIDLPTATASNNGLLSRVDWARFNAVATVGNLTTPTTGMHIAGGTGAVIGGGAAITIDTASASGPGLLSANDWSKFNAASGTAGDLSSPTSGVTITGGARAVLSAGAAISIATASASTAGLLSSTDWSTFNGKQDALTLGNLTGTANRLGVTGGTGAVVGAGATLNIDTSLLPSPVLADVGKALIATAANIAAWTTISTADELVKVSATDTTAGYLYAKLAQGNAIAITKSNDPGNASVNIAVSGLQATDIPSLDAAKITSGIFDIARIPLAAIERLVIVADAAARHALTTATVQNGDTVKQSDTGEMWYVYDSTQLSVDAGYRVYTAGTATNFGGSLAGDVTGTQGSTAISASTVTGKLLTGFNPAPGTVAGTDTILQGINKLAGDFAQVNPAQILTVAKSGAKYTSIQTAIDAIIDASSSKPYLVFVNPGVYNEQVTLKDWVFLQGVDINSVIITQTVTGILGTLSAGAKSGINGLTVQMNPNTTTSCRGLYLSGDYVLNNLEINITTGSSFSGAIYAIDIVSNTLCYLGLTGITIIALVGTVTYAYGMNLHGSNSLSLYSSAVSMYIGVTTGVYSGYNIDVTSEALVRECLAYLNFSSISFVGTVYGFSSASTSVYRRLAKNCLVWIKGAGGAGGTAVALQLDSGGNSSTMNHDAINVNITGFPTANSFVANTGATDSQRIWLTSSNMDLPQNMAGLSVMTPQDQQCSGFVRWGGAGSYWGFVVGTGVFTLLRPAAGVVNSTPIIIPANQTVTLTNFATNYIYADSTGTLRTSTSETDTLYINNVFLFIVWSDGTYYQVTKENHNYNFPTNVRNTWETVFSTLITGAGANLTQLGAAANRQIAIVGNDTICDQGVESSIVSAPTVALTFYPNYVNASGKMQQVAAGNTAIVSNYNNAGTPTNVGNNKYCNKRIGVLKDSLNSIDPQYISILDTVQYNTAATAAAAISSGTVQAFPPEALALEVVQLGFVTIKANGSGGGSITTITISKQAFGAALIGGSASSQASLITTDTTNFVTSGGISSVLSGADVTAQAALNTLARGISSRYTAALSWTGVGPYTMTITGATHLRGTDPVVRCRELVSGSLYNVVYTDISIDDSTGDVVLTSSNNFTGKVVIV